MTILYFPLRNVDSLMGHVSCSSHLSSNSACCFISFDFISLSSTYYPVWDPGGYTHIRWTGVLSGNFEKSLSEIPRSCFVGVVWTFSTFKRYQFWKNTLTFSQFLIAIKSFAFEFVLLVKDYEQSFFRLVCRAWRERKPREKNYRVKSYARFDPRISRGFLSGQARQTKQKKDYS